MASSEKSKHDQKSLSSGLTRRQFLPLLGATAALAAVAPRAFADDEDSSPSHAQARFVYVGTYTAPDVPPGGTHPSIALGIYVFRLDPSDGGLTQLQIVPASNPSFVALDPTLTHLYSVNEDSPGRVSAYAINPATGALTFLNTATANGQFTTHINVHPSGQYFYAANYGTGNFPVYRILANGSIGPMTDLFQSVGNGTGPNPARQEGPHAHQILTDVGGNHVFGVDLGADKVNVLNLNLGTGLFSPNTVPFAPVASGSGSRHMAFHPNTKRAYVLDELVSTITVFDYDPTRGALIWKQTLSTLPDNFTGTNTTAEIRIHPSGRFLYNTNRGHNSVTMYEIDSQTGELDVIGWESTHGQWPRGMNIDPSGTYLYAANQNTDTIAVFRMDRWAVGNGQDNGQDGSQDNGQGNGQGNDQGNDQGNSQGTEPPKSNYPSLLNGTLVTLAEAAAAFPKIPSVSFPTVYDTYELLGFGPLFDSHGGILTLQPPVNGPSYAIRLPKTDGNGIDLAGVHQIESRAPLGTSTGWNIRSAAHRGPNLCVLTGSYFPFATTKAERLQSGDPRPSLQELYGSHQGFVNAVAKAAADLVKERFLLEVDADADISAAQASTVLN